MKLLINFFIVSEIFNLVVAQVTIFDRQFLPFMRFARELVFEYGRPSNFELAYRTNLRKGRVQTPFDDSVPFFCNINGPGARSRVPPNSVHRLTPGDIDIVGAIGDSLTAANGVWAQGNDPQSILIEGKGVSFSIGGQGNWRKFLTIPNILKEFNPNLYGYPVEDSYAYKKSSKFNVAEPISMSSDIAHQARNLIKRMRSDSRVDMENHWKLVTLFIGGNDFCLDICYYEEQDRIVRNAEYDLVNTLRTLRDYLPRTMVNVILPPNVIELLFGMKGKSNECLTLHYIECPCVFSLNQQKNVKRSLKTIKKWRSVFTEVVTRKEFHEKPDFTVNLMPFTDNIQVPRNSKGNTDFTYLSYDCFHLSQKGNAIAANSLWNNMLEPANNRSRSWDKEFKVMKCPTAQSPYLTTVKNS